MIKKLLSCLFPAENDDSRIATNVPNYGANAYQNLSNTQTGSSPFGSTKRISDGLPNQEEPKTPPPSSTRLHPTPQSTGSVRSTRTSSTVNNSPNVGYQYNSTNDQPDLESDFGDLGFDTQSNRSSTSACSL